MFLNYDSVIVLSTIIVGGIFTYSFYDYIFTTVNTSESLVNTPNIQSSNAETVHNVETVLHNLHTNVGVQTETLSTWQIIKDWFRETFSINSSDLTSLGHTRVENWIGNLNTTQSTPSLDTTSDISYLNLQDLTQVTDSASNISEVVSTFSSEVVYQINDWSTYNNLIIVPDARFSHIVWEGVDQYFIIINNAILSINPDLFNYFI